MSRTFTDGSAANAAPDTGMAAPVPPAFCRICATMGDTVCIPAASTTEYVGLPSTCGVETTVPTGPGAPTNPAAVPWPGMVGTVSGGATGTALNNAALIGRAAARSSALTPSANNTGR